MPNKAFLLAEAAMPGWKAVRSAAGSDRARTVVEVDARGVDVAKLRAKYFGKTKTAGAVADAASQISDGEIVKVESTRQTGTGPKQLHVLVSNGKVTGVQG